MKILLYLWLSCVLTVSQMFPKMFKSKEICFLFQVMVRFIWSPVTIIVMWWIWQRNSVWNMCLTDFHHVRKLLGINGCNVSSHVFNMVCCNVKKKKWWYVSNRFQKSLLEEILSLCCICPLLYVMLFFLCRAKEESKWQSWFKKPIFGRMFLCLRTASTASTRVSLPLIMR